MPQIGGKGWPGLCPPPPRDPGMGPVHQESERNMKMTWNHYRHDLIGHFHILLHPYVAHFMSSEDVEGCVTQARASNFM